MQTLVVDHPLIAHKLTTLRDERTDSPTFRRLTDELVTLLAYEATREVRVQPEVVQTPVGEARGVKLALPPPLVVPVLRAGIGMLDGMIRLLPTADVGFVGWPATRNPWSPPPTPTGSRPTWPAATCSCWTPCWPPGGPWRP